MGIFTFITELRCQELRNISNIELYTVLMEEMSTKLNV